MHLASELRPRRREKRFMKNERESEKVDIVVRYEVSSKFGVDGSKS